MKTFIKKSNNQLYIVDVDSEIKVGDIEFDNIFRGVYENTGGKRFDASKVIATIEQIDIDNLWDKYLEALAEKKADDFNVSKSNIEWQSAYRCCLQSKKETPFSESDLLFIFRKGVMYNSEDSFFENVIQQLKLSKIPECGVEIEMESERGWIINGVDGNIPNAPKLTTNKVTITKIIL